MPELTISEVARQVGLQASAIRYYERIGLLPRAPRVGGQRRYDSGKNTKRKTKATGKKMTMMTTKTTTA